MLYIFHISNWHLAQNEQQLTNSWGGVAYSYIVYPRNDLSDCTKKYVIDVYVIAITGKNKEEEKYLVLLFRIINNSLDVKGSGREG